jgi:cellulose synthase operon protein C
MKRRPVLILIVVGVIALVGGGIWWYVRANTGWRMLAKVQLAIKANQFDKAVEQAGSYVDKFPDDWQGYYWQAQGYLRMGKYPEARASLDKIRKAPTPLKCDQAAVALLMAETYAQPAARTLATPDAYRQTQVAYDAIAQMEKASAELSASTPADEKSQSDMAQAQASILLTLSQAYDALARHHEEAAKLAEKTGGTNATQAKSEKDQAVTCDQKSQQDRTEAVAKIVLAISKDATRAAATAQRAVEWCLVQKDTAGLEAMRKAVFALPDPPPAVAATLIYYETQNESSPKAARLDDILKRHPEDSVAKIIRARVALALNDLPTAQRLCDEVLAKDARNPEARMIHAELLRSRGNLAEAEQELFSLKTDIPRPDFIEAYALTAKANNKKELAREAMRSITRIAPNHAGARKFLAESLREDGIYQQAFEEARKSIEVAPDDPEAIVLFTDLAKKTDQADLARQTLQSTREKYVDKPLTLMAVARSYSLLGDNQAAQDVIQKSTTQPTNTDAKLAVVQALLAVGQVAQAQQMLKDLAAGGDKPSAQASYLQGRVYIMTDNLLQAIECFRSAAQADPKNTAYQAALARALLTGGQIDECQAVLDSMDTADAAAGLMRMEMRILRGQAPDTMELLQQTQAAGQSGLPLALRYYAAGQFRQCVDACLEELKRNPAQEREVRSLLSQAYLAQGDRDHALEQVKSLLTAWPSDQSIYFQLASILLRQKDSSIQKDTDKIVAEMLAVPKARKELVEIARGTLLEEMGQLDQAGACYAQLVSQAEAPAPIRQQAQIRLAQVLAKTGQLTKALAEIDKLTGDEKIGPQVKFLRAQLLLANNQKKEAAAAADEILAVAKQQQLPSLATRVAGLYVAMKDYDKALAVCEDLHKAQPQNAQILVLKAQVLVQAQRAPEAVEAYTQAAKADPGNMSVRVALARALDSQQRLDLALKALDELDAQGQAGQAVCLQEKAYLMMRSGLYQQAADCLEKLAGQGLTKNPRSQLMLGQAMASLGKKERAVELLKAIPAYAGEYLPAGQVLVALADTPEARLAIIDDLEKSKPGTTALLQERMRVLLAAGRPAAAPQAFREYADAHKGAALPMEAAFMAVTAACKTGDYPAGMEIASVISSQTPNPFWRQVQVTLGLAISPEKPQTLLPPAQRADLVDTMLGLCQAGLTGDAKSAAAWADRFDEIEKKIQSNGGSVPAVFGVLVNTAAGRQDAAKAALSKSKGLPALSRLGMVELLDSSNGRTNSASEASGLLLSVVAYEMRLPDLAVDLARKALKARPGCQVAAALVLQGKPGDKDVLEALKGDTSAFARLASAIALMQQGQYEPACKILAEACAANPDDAELQVQYGGALEGTGKNEDALKVYLQTWSTSGHIGAANNAAYVISVEHSKDAAMLAQARTMVEKALATSPDAPAFRDTLGWILLLQGQNEKACAELRQALKGMPTSPEAQYHMGMAEAAAGRKDFAQYHLETAIRLGQELTKQGKVSPQVDKTVNAAQEALKSVKAGS